MFGLSTACIIHLQHFYLPTHEIWMRPRWPGTTSAGCLLPPNKVFLCIVLTFHSAFNFITECCKTWHSCSSIQSLRIYCFEQIVASDHTRVAAVDTVSVNWCVPPQRCNYTSELLQLWRYQMGTARSVGCMCFSYKFPVPVKIVDVKLKLEFSCKQMLLTKTHCF